MKKLIHDPACRGKEVRFSTSQDLAFWLNSRRNGTLFAVNEHASIVYTVTKINEETPRAPWAISETPWAISCHSGFYRIPFDKLVDQYDLYFIDDDQMIALIKAL
jgi:hypothetical protein